jgi:hypothetical protein
MKAEDDNELLTLIDFYQMTRVDTYRFKQDSLLSDKAREGIFSYIDQHYDRKPDTTGVTSTSVLEAAYVDLAQYEEWHAKGEPCFQDVLLRIDMALAAEKQ